MEWLQGVLSGLGGGVAFFEAWQAQGTSGGGTIPPPAEPAPQVVPGISNTILYIVAGFAVLLLIFARK
jgi:hypothetical protein